jgi:hypothetical protein
MRRASDVFSVFKNPVTDPAFWQLAAGFLFAMMNRATQG